MHNAPRSPEYTLQPIGQVRNERTDPGGGNWDLTNSTIQLDLDAVPADSTDGLRQFSHVEVIFICADADPATTNTGTSLARRDRTRRNRLGVATCELMGVRPNGVIELRGLDAVDGSPVLDVRPYVAELAPRGDVSQPAWSHEQMSGYWAHDQSTGDASSSLRSVKVHPDVQPDAWLAEVKRSPADRGTLEMIVCRPDVEARDVLETGELDLDLGLVGDNWLHRGSRSRPDGSANPDAQLNIMNWRCASLVAGSADRVPLAGDQLFLDLDLSADNLPPGTRLSIGSAVIEVTAEPHTGCAKFTRRFGLAAHRWVNGHDGKREHLRGICAKVVVAGTIHRGDTVTKVAPGL